jgi:hypothetical protein
VLRFALNETSPQNHLVFFETDVESVRSQWNGTQTHMLHGLYANIDGQAVFYDEVAPITYLSNTNTIPRAQYRYRAIIVGLVPVDHPLLQPRSQRDCLCRL